MQKKFFTVLIYGLFLCCLCCAVMLLRSLKVRDTSFLTVKCHLTTTAGLTALSLSAYCILLLYLLVEMQVQHPEQP